MVDLQKSFDTVIICKVKQNNICCERSLTWQQLHCIHHFQFHLKAGLPCKPSLLVHSVLKTFLVLT